MEKHDGRFEFINEDGCSPPQIFGSLWFVNERDDGSDSPIKLKQFKNSIEGEESSATLSRINIIPKNEKSEQQITFDCYRIENSETSFVKLLLHEDGTVSGKIEFPEYEGEPVEYFRGEYKISKSKISIWGVWAEDIDFEELHSVFIEFKKIKNKDEELEYDEDEAVEFIRQNISNELDEKLSHKDIVTLIDLEDEYVEIEYQKNEKRKPYVSFKLRTIDQDHINAYVLKNAVQHNIILTLEEVEEIMYAEIDYMEEEGLIDEEVFCLN